MQTVADILRQLKNKLERQQRAVQDTEHHIQILSGIPAEQPMPTPLEDAIAAEEARDPKQQAGRRAPARGTS